jgi:acyl-CoA thioesterase-2
MTESPPATPTPEQLVRELIGLLRLERLEDDLFRGPSRDIGTTRVFGGQVLGQAIQAAQYTVEERGVHSLHAYFLREGDHTAPIVYTVDRSRDGRSFSARRVVAIQHGQPIFTMSASFQSPEPGVDHQLLMPAAADPETLPDLSRLAPEVTAVVPEKIRRILMRTAGPFEFRAEEPLAVFGASGATAPVTQMWFRIPVRLPDDDLLHRAMLAYVSDYGLLTSALAPHGLNFGEGRLQLASIDHAMWFHRPFRVDDWLLYRCDSPSASGGRGLGFGSIFRRDGTLVASAAQEGLLRVIAAPSA